MRDADFFLGFSESGFHEGFALFPMSAGKADIPRLIYPCGAFCQNEMQFSAYLCQQSKNGEMAQLSCEEKTAVTFFRQFLCSMGLSPFLI